MELQQEIAFEKAQETVGRTLLVMVEGKVPDEHAYVARSYKDAPNVDGFVFVQMTRLYFLAILPSSRSVRLAMIKIASAIGSA